jgi:hypothetical protein
MAVGFRGADRVTPSILKNLALTLLTSGSWPVGILYFGTEATEFAEFVFDVM